MGFSLVVLTSKEHSPSPSSNWNFLSKEDFFYSNKKTISNMSTKIIVVVPTYYADLNDIRYQLALDCCTEIQRHGLEMIVVDASPQNERIQQEMTQKGLNVEEPTRKSRVQVVRQTELGRKGAALRQGIALALKQAQDRNETHETIIAFQEPEKSDMIRFWKPVVQHMLHEHADVIVPTRSNESFLSTYPIEQYHSETFANLHLNTLGQQSNTPLPKHPFPSNLDWTMGPVAIRADTMAAHYLSYMGDSYDMQLVPLVRAHRWHKAKIVASMPIDYQHPAEMKRQEEGVPTWNEKRLLQLNFLFQHVGNAWEEVKEGGD